MRQLLDQFGVPERAIAAYNAGPGRESSVVSGRSSIPRETAAYVPGVVNKMKGATVASNTSGPKLVPVDHDPFASDAAQSPTLTPVDHDPFADAGATAPQPDYSTWDTAGPTPPPGMAPQDLPVPLKKEPGYYYGSVLPFRIKQDAAGNDIPGTQQVAVPEMIRAPVRGLVEGGQAALGKRPGLLADPGSMSDIGAAGAVFGGARPSVAETHALPKSPARPAAVEARAAGYVLPPQSISDNPGLVAKTLAGWSGKIKTQQAASEKNQEVTNQLAATALGLPRETVLTPETLNQVRQQAGSAYQAVIDAVPAVRADQDFKDLVSTLGGSNSQAAKAFPKITNNPGIKELVEELGGADEHPTAAWVELVKELRFNATSNLRAFGDPSKQALGLAQREAANAVDDMMERQIDASGQPGVIDAYRSARKLIAKAYDVETATNSATGDVNARILARLSDKGRPLTDELRTIANAALAFPKAMQPTAAFGDNEAWSALDFFGSAAALTHGESWGGGGNPSAADCQTRRAVQQNAEFAYPHTRSRQYPHCIRCRYRVVAKRQSSRARRTNRISGDDCSKGQTYQQSGWIV